MLDHTATTWLKRLLIWLELFEQDFSRQSQRGALRRYVTGLLSDSRRKSMEAMWARLSDPGTYQAFQHFITHAPWDAESLWKRLRARVPERTGVLILDGTSFPKQGTASVGVARQYCGARGKIANCQTAVTVALWTGTRAWLLGATLYLPEEWLTPGQRAQAQIPATVLFAPKWQLALTLLRQVRAAGFTLTAVVGDAEFGDNATLRRTLHRAKLPYALGVSSDLKVFLGTPGLESPPPLTGKGRPRTRRRLPPETQTIEARVWAATQTPRRWRFVSWRNGTNPPWRARFCAVRVTPAHDWRGPDGSRPKSGCCANGIWLAATVSVTTWCICRPPRRCAPLSVWPISDGRSSSSTKNSKTSSARSLRRPQPAGVATPCRLDGHRLQFSPERTPPTRQTLLTLPHVRAVIQEVFTAHFFMTQPHYFKWMLKLKDVELRT